MKKVKVNEMAEELTSLLTKYSDEVTIECKKAVQEVAEGCNREIKNHITFKDKKYSKSFNLYKAFEDERNKRQIWYVKSPHYRLTHLLEFGHLTRNGGRTKAFPHVKYGDDYVKRELPLKVEEAIERCKI